MAQVLDRVAPAVEAVADEDVEYTLDVCREVNRIYQRYQDGCIDASRELMSGLIMTRDMLRVMATKVTVGMAAMRIAVAVAQTDEIVAVLYGQAAVVSMDAATQVRLRRRQRSVVTASVQGRPGLPPAPPAPAMPVAVVPDSAAPTATRHRRRWFTRRTR